MFKKVDSTEINYTRISELATCDFKLCIREATLFLGYLCHILFSLSRLMLCRRGLIACAHVPVKNVKRLRCIKKGCSCNLQG